MDVLSKESLGHDEEEATKSIDESQWHLRTISTYSIFDTDVNKWNQNYNLQLVQKRELHSERPVIPATKWEKLSYYRAYVSSPSKTEIVCMQHVQFNSFLWNYIFNVFCKSLPNSYVYMFLGSYASERHLFLSRMVPFFYGSNWLLIIAGFLELITYTDNCILLFDYVICGMLQNNPWNRCHLNSFPYRINNKTVQCYEISEFSKIVANSTPKFYKTFYVSPSNKELFQLAPIEYFRSREHKLDMMSYARSYFCIYFACIWILAALHYNQLFKRYIWKTLNTVQWLLNFIFITTFLHLLWTHFEGSLKYIPERTISIDEINDILWEADIDLLAESMTAPPVLHVLTARSTEEVNPSSDSTVMITSNAIYYLFRGLLAYRLKRYCDSMVGAPIHITQFNPHSWFYFWPIYFSTFYLGDLYTLIFFTLNFCMEFFTFTITYQCLVEVVVCEWKWARRWLVTSFLIVFAIFMNIISTHESRIFLYIYSKGVPTIIEIIVLYGIYPFSRLVDDITFHYGVTPSTLRLLNLQLVPIFYVLKFYLMTKGFTNVLEQTSRRYYSNIYHLYDLSWIITISPVLFGMVYITYVFLYKQRKQFREITTTLLAISLIFIEMRDYGTEGGYRLYESREIEAGRVFHTLANWVQMFRPYPDWGPRDFIARQLRKQYDSREYVGSQASRELSRFLIKKAESKAYHLDIRYDVMARRSTQSAADLRFENEKKNV